MCFGSWLGLSFYSLGYYYLACCGWLDVVFVFGGCEFWFILMGFA